MTEAEWLTASDPVPMLEFVQVKATSRKLRLLCCAWFRATRWEDDLDGDEQRHAIQVAELFANGMATEEQRRSAADELRRLNYDHDTCYFAWRCVDEERHFTYSNDSVDHLVVSHLLRDYPVTLNTLRIWTWPKLIRNERRFLRLLQIQLLREFFGNPFRPASMNPTWLTSTVLALAHQMYDSRDFSAMPILADALQDAECDDEDVLNHCRGEGVHVRGCWVVDLLTGRK